MSNVPPPSPAPSPLPSAGRRSARREQLADDFLASIKALKRSIDSRMPQDVREEVSGVTIHQLEALVGMVHCSEGLTMNDLARRQGTGPSSCTAMADRLIRQGLAERSGDPTDRRVVRLVATARARGLVEGYLSTRREAVLSLLDTLGDDDVRTLTALLRRMAATPEEAG